MSVFSKSGADIKKAKLGSGERFHAVENSVAAGYEKKGMSKEKAEKIGAAVAAKQGAKKLGQKKMTELAAAGRRRRANRENVTFNG